jgi:hypothetical protein
MSEIINFHGQTVEIRRVPLGGVERPVAFVTYTFLLFKRKTGIDYFKLTPEDELSNEDALQLYHCAMVVGGIVTGEAFEIPFEPDFLIMCDDNVMFALAGIQKDNEVPAQEESEKVEEKNGQSHSRSKSSKKRAVEK